MANMKGLFVFLIAVFNLVQASHFRYGTLTWSIPDFANKPNEVQLSLSVIMRTGYYPAGSVYVGAVVPIYVPTISDIQFYFGDGTYAKPNGTVTNVQADSFQAVWTVLHAYPMSSTPKNYTSYFDSQARLDTLNNNGGKHYRVSTFITLFGPTKNTSPRSVSAAIREFAQNGMRVIDLQAVDDETSAALLDFKLSTPTQMGDAAAVQPPGLSILANKTILWNTYGVALGLWNAQFRITDGKGAFIVVDLLFNLTVEGLHPPPYYIAPSPTNGFVFNVTVGGTVEFDIAATSDYVEDVVVINPSLPSFCIIAAATGTRPTSRHVTCTPTSANDAGQNPVSFTLSPGGATIGVVINVFLAATPPPTAAPTAMPSIPPTAEPTAMPSIPPTAEPTPMPSVPPTATPTAMPTIAPTAMPSMPPSMAPTATPIPSAPPSMAPTTPPTSGPFCGDGTCQAAENCKICEADCGDCPMVIWAHGKSGYVVSAAALTAGSAITLTPYDNASVPTVYQAWKYTADKHIVLRVNANLFLGAGPKANNKNDTVTYVDWDFKAAVGSLTSIDGPKIVNRFNFVATTAPWSFITDVQLNKHSLKAPYNGTDDVWGSKSTVVGAYTQQFMWGTYVCHMC